MKKKYMIRCDIEGVSGVVSYEQAEPSKPEYAFGQRMFMADLNACIEGLTDGGADEILIYDEHYYGRNIEIDKLPSNVTAICGKPPYRPDWAGGLDSSFSGMILIGFHSKFGTKNGLLHHSYELDIRDLRLNGLSIGEIGMESAIAGDHNVPVVLVTADSAGIAEAQKILPGINSVVVKESLSETGGLCYAGSITSAAIKQTSKKTVKTPPPVKPLKINGRVKLEVELNPGQYLIAIRNKFKDSMTNENTLIIEAINATSAWADYWQKKLLCQKYMQEHIL